MRKAWHFTTKVLPRGRIEVADPKLPAGATVDVFVVPRVTTKRRRSALEVLAQAPGQRQLKTAEEVDRYLREEREAWDS